ncbi:MAG: DUF5110 domain-containing protein [Bacteroides sp.]|nr:DUF5110 domain-containing protein [Bacteroides sp.]
MKQNLPKWLLCGLTLISGLTLPASAVEKSNPLVFGRNRLSIITPTLLRLEHSRDSNFIDEPTIFAYDRSSMLDTAQITVTELPNNWVEITTPALRIRYHNDGFPFSTANLNVFYTHNGKEKKFTNRFITKNNLGGPIETLDRVTAEIPMNDGILSKDGWYMIDDGQSDLLVNGWIQPRNTANHIQDQYCFIYGNDFRAALSSLGAISGRVPMTRKYIHGVWYCRYWDYTADEFLDIVRGYDENDFPLDNIVFDMGWHTNNATTGTGHNGNLSWNGYSWNKELIPNPKALIDSCHNRGVTVSLNDHPHDGVRPHEDSYSAFIAELGHTGSDVPLFNPADSAYMAAFFNHAHRPSEDMGVDFWWLDWQQNYLYPKVPGHQSTTLQWLNELYYRDSQAKGQRGAGYSRWGGWGDHRHPIQFSGDAQSNWPILAFEVKLTACSGQGGCYYWAHDIGGFRGEPNPELTTRWTQFGALSAALRVHSTKDARLDRRPWISGEKFTGAMRRMYHLRSQLMPYIYSCVWETHNTMVPLNRSMFIDYGTQPESFHQPQQFTFGPLIMAAPITSPGTGADLVAEQKVWFPEGEVWYDFFTHQPQQGGQTRQIAKSIDEFPMYVRGGWVLPLQPYTARPATEPLTHLIMRIYPSETDADNTFTLYEDDGTTLDYTKGIYSTTDLNYTRRGNHTTVTVHPAKGSYPSRVKSRSYTLQLPTLTKATTVKVNGKKRTTAADPATGIQSVNVPAMPLTGKLTIEYDI